MGFEPDAGRRFGAAARVRTKHLFCSGRGGGAGTMGDVLNANVANSRVDLKTGDFDFDLPPENIATAPARPRESARLLEIGDTLVDRLVGDLPSLLAPGDIVVVNDTRVIPARLRGTRRGAGPMRPAAKRAPKA